ncbi:MAG: hypothetical protein ABI222_05745 [Opitutaceae bacterium]
MKLLTTIISRLGVGLAILVVVLAALYLWSCNPFKLGAPSDQELVALFRDHREAFDRLRTMGIEDAQAISYVSEDSLKQSSLTQARRDEYTRLLSGIRRDLVMGVDANAVSFSYWGGGVGLAIARSWKKGIAYLPNGPKKVGVIVSSLDKLPANDGVYLVPVEGNWYLIYVQID